MKKTKTLSILVAIVLGVCACFTMIACEEQTEHTHEYKWTVTTAPTLDKGGTLTGACEADGSTKTVEVPALSDTDFWKSTVKAPTHTDAGYTSYTSAEYNVSVRVPGDPALGHDWGAWEVKADSKPTQNGSGLAIHYCTANDGGQETAELKPLSDAEFWTVKEQTEATHTAAGKTVYHNDTYSLDYTVTVAAKGHGDRWSAWTVKEGNEPSFTAGGKIIRTCLDNDGGEETRDVPALSNTTFWVPGEIVGGDCETPGTRQYVNSQYSVSFGVEVPPLGHDLTDWEWEDGEPTLTSGGTLTRHCKREGDEEYSETKSVAALNNSSVWTKDVNASVSANYNTAAFDVYKANIEDVGELVVRYKTADKLTAPYDNKDYVSFSYDTDEVNTAVSRYNHWSYNNDPDTHERTSLSGTMVFTPETDGFVAASCFNEYAWVISQGHFTLELIDASNGKLKITVREMDRTDSIPTIKPNGKVTEYYGFVEMSSGVMVVPTPNRLVVFVPVDIDDYTTKEALDTVDAIESTMSIWDGGIAVSLKVSAAAATNNIFVRDGDAYFNVKFKNSPLITGTDIAAENCFKADYVAVFDKDDDKLYGFGKNASGVLVETDGLEGTYTGTIDVFDFEEQTTDGNKAFSFTLNGAGFGTIVSGPEKYTGSNFTLRYVKAAAGAGYAFGLYIVNDGTDAAYYHISVGDDSYTFTGEVQLITITRVYNNTVDGKDTDSATWFANVTTEVGDFDEVGFLGWYDNPGLNGSPVHEVNSETDVTLYGKWSLASIEFKLYGKTAETYVTVYFADGDTLGDILPELTDAQKINPVNNTGFVGWFVEVDGVEYSADEEALLSTEYDDGSVYYGKWDPLGIWSFEMDNRYGWVYDGATGYWKSNSAKINASNSSATMRITANDGPITISFKWWTSTETSDKLTIRHYKDASQSNDVLVNGVGGNKTIADAQEIKITLTDGQSLFFDYKKDSSVDSYDDRVYLAELMINGRVITVPNSPDFMEGSYSSSGDSLVLDGYGNFTWGDKTGTYKKAEGKSYYDMFVVEDGKRTEYYELTLNGSAYSVNKAMVNVSYSAGSHNVPSTVSVNKYIEYTLAEGIVNAGYIFRGWYSQNGASSGEWGNKLLSVTPDANVTVFGKYEAQVTVTWNYLVDGTPNATDNTKYVSDSIEYLQSIEGIVNGNKTFAGWFTKNGTLDGDWGTQVTVNTVLTETNVTFYAKWVDPHPMAGSYKGYELYNGYVYGASSAAKTLTVDALGNVSGSVTGVIGEYSPETGIAVITGQARYVYYDAETETIAMGYNQSTATLNNDIYVFVKSDNVSAISQYDNVAYWVMNSLYTYIVEFNVDDEVKTYFVHNNKVYGDVQASATTAAGENVQTVPEFATAGNFVTVKDSEGNIILEFISTGAKGSEIQEADVTRGTYKSDAGDDLFLNGSEDFTWGDKSGKYYEVDADAFTYKLLVKEGGKNVESYTVVINYSDTDNRTYTATENKVTINYETAHASQDAETVWADVEYTLPTGLTEEGYIFRGWYNNDGTTSGEWGSLIDTVTPELGETYTYYAKWDAAATITWNYLVSGTPNDTQTDKYVGDKIGTVKAIGDVTNGTLLFFGWFTADGTQSGDWGEQVTADTVVAGVAVTYYAKWGEAHALTGTYKGVEFDSTALRGSTYGNLTIDPLGTVSGTKSGTLVEVGDGVYTLNGSYLYYDAVGKTIVTNYGNGTTLGTDLYVYTYLANPDTDTVSGSYANQNTSTYAVWDSNYTKLGVFKVNNVDKVFFVYNGKVYGNVEVLINGTATTNLTGLKTKNNVVTIKDANGNQVFKGSYDGSGFVGADGLDGTYEGEYGQIVVDGYGNLTFAGGTLSLAYTVIEGRKITFVNASRMYVVTLGDGAYTKELDGFEGTYNLPGGAGTVTLDGYGKTGDGRVYNIVNGTQLTIFNAADGSSASYGIEKGNPDLLGKSVFAGMRFSGTVNTEWDTGESMSIVFNDSADLSGRITISTEWLDFTAEITGKTIVFTVTNTFSSSSEVGHTLTFTISDDMTKLTHVSNTLSRNIIKVTGTPTLTKQG
ncbi:MAG: InlB B-repeat-containing protein [Clostridiales bacterium]|nr:InlB B-repeat-containing protein [Clostridiales bacterium]